MKLVPHVIAGTAAGTLCAYSTKEPWALPIALGAAVLPDVDHLFDFYWQYIRGSRKRLFLLFHSWELAIGLYFYTYYLSSNDLPQYWWIASIQLGYFSQLLLDQIGNHASWHTYFWLIRAARRFKRRSALGYDNPGFYISLTHSLPIIGPKIEPWFIRKERELYPDDIRTR